jgi:hypothetical protein
MTNLIIENGQMIEPVTTQTTCVPEMVKQNAETENTRNAAGSNALTLYKDEA